MSPHDAEQRALRPLWMLVTGVAAGCALVFCTSLPAPRVLVWILLALGALATGRAVAHRGGWALWLAAGLALGVARAAVPHAGHLSLERALARDDLTARARMTILEGWSRARWGWRSRVRLAGADAGPRSLALPGTCRLEVRGGASPLELPAPGTTVASLVAVRGEPSSPLLVATSPRLLDELRGPRGLPHLRDLLARRLLAAAGTDLSRIRSAELAAALVLGRRDLLPEDRREGWRRSGLAHLLAVSGLHVGLVAAAVWLGLVMTGVSPRASRLVLLVVLPGYALLAGAAPSAVRAALMGMVYLGARLVGRAVLPMAAVLLTAGALLLARPPLLLDPGFQLTILITAALVRWAPPLAQAVPGPRWSGAVVAVPVVAQLAAAPLVAWHFRNAVPGAVAANLLVPFLLTPTLLGALAAATLAPWWPAAAALCLRVVGLGRSALWLVGGAGRSLGVAVPALPALAVGVLVAFGWLALRPGRRARYGVAGWATALLAAGCWWWLGPAAGGPAVTLLPVTDGVAAVVDSGRGRLLMDGGRWPDQATRLLADHHLSRPHAVLASHTDEDHIGALAEVLAGFPARTLLLPAWMVQEPATVALLRAARNVGTVVVPAAAGSVVEVADVRIEVLWPPARGAPAGDNERSLVARVRLPGGVVLLTADIGRATERLLVRRADLGCDVLLVPHHGSRESTSPELLAAASPAVALIPAGPGNLYHHPHPEVLHRLAARRIPLRCPAFDGLCGAVLHDGRWLPVP